MNKSHRINMSGGELEDKLLEFLPNSENTAIPIDAIRAILPYAEDIETRSAEYSFISNILKLLVDASICKRNKSFGLYHFWVDKSILKKGDPSLLSSKIIVLLEQRGYKVRAHAQTPFLDLIYLYKTAQEKKGHEFLARTFVEWIITHSKFISNHEFSSKNIEHLIIDFHRHHAETSSNIGMKVLKQKNNQSLLEYLRTALPLKEDQAVTSKALSGSLQLDHRKDSISSALSLLYLKKEIRRKGINSGYSYWNPSKTSRTKNSNGLSNLSKINVSSLLRLEGEDKSEATSLPPFKREDILARIKAVETDIAQIHKRYETVEGLIQEKELSTQLLKLEQSKDKEQRRLNQLEERLRKWSIDEMNLRKGVLK